MRFVLGVDEAGRGPLAGPVMVGAVMAPEEYDILRIFPGLNDSKKLSEKKREKIFEILLSERAAGRLLFCVKSVSAKAIDAHGIGKAVISCVHAGVRQLAPKLGDVQVYLDGSLHGPKEYEQETVIGGDAKIPIIMLASIAAKVSRDRIMAECAKEYPGYGFEQHKGYGTKAHREAIVRLGLSALHRKSFCKKVLAEREACV